MQSLVLAYCSSCFSCRSVSYRCSQSHTVTWVAVHKFAIQLSSTEHPKALVTPPRLNFGCLVCLTIFLWSILPKQDVYQTSDSELIHSFKCCIVHKLLKISWQAVHLAFSFALSLAGDWSQQVPSLWMHYLDHNWSLRTTFTIFLADDAYVPLSLYLMWVSDELALTSVWLGCCNLLAVRGIFLLD